MKEVVKKASNSTPQNLLKVVRVVTARSYPNPDYNLLLNKFTRTI